MILPLRQTCVLAQVSSPKSIATPWIDSLPLLTTPAASTRGACSYLNRQIVSVSPSRLANRPRISRLDERECLRLLSAPVPLQVESLLDLAQYGKDVERKKDPTGLSSTLRSIIPAPTPSHSRWAGLASEAESLETDRIAGRYP
jgi:hypothetical protein